MYKSASETTLKTSSTPTGNDNTDYSQADAAKKEAQAAVMDITGLPGMAETAGIFAYSSALHGMSVAEAVQATMTHLWVWTWATPEAKAKRAAQEQEQEEEHDPVLERLIAEARAIREAPLSAFAADAEDEEEEIETQPVAEQHDPVLERLIAEARAIREAPLSAFAADAEEGALEEFEAAAAWERF
jgi:hypothetical protein